MTWRHFLWDVQSGQLGAEIQIPSFSWSMDVSDSSMSTTTEKGTGDASLSSISLPWSAIPGRREDLAGTLVPGRAGICSMWDEVPILCSVITGRTDTFKDTSLTTAGIMSAILAHRMVVREGKFGSADSITWSGLSLGTIQKRVVQQVMQKPAGVLAIDFQADETAANDADHTRTYNDWDVQNISASDVLTKLANVENGPDIQFRPYLVDDSHVRLQMLTGTEHNPFIGQATEHSWSAFKGSDSIQDLQAQWDASALANRVYATGSGSDAGTLMALGEDLSSLQAGYPIYEATFSDTSTDNVPLLQSHANAQVQLLSKPLMQLSGKVRADGPVPLGQFWPGEMTVLNIADFPTIPDGQYRVRLMSMSGDQTASVSLKWQVMEVTA